MPILLSLATGFYCLKCSVNVSIKLTSKKYRHVNKVMLKIAVLWQKPTTQKKDLMR